MKKKNEFFFVTIPESKCELFFNSGALFSYSTNVFDIKENKKIENGIHHIPYFSHNYGKKFPDKFKNSSSFLHFNSKSNCYF